MSSTWCFIRVFQHGFLHVTLRLVDCLTGLHIGITSEGNRRIVVVSEINIFSTFFNVFILSTFFFTFLPNYDLQLVLYLLRITMCEHL